MTDHNELSLGASLAAFLETGRTLNERMDKIAKQNDALWRRLQADTPVQNNTAASGVFPASGNLTLALGTPDRGTYWEVQSVVVGGTDVNVTAAGKAGLYVTASPGAIGLNNCHDYAASLPNVGFYGGRQLYVNDGEQVYVVVFGGTVGQTYVANISYTVFNVAASSGGVTWAS